MAVSVFSAGPRPTQPSAYAAPGRPVSRARQLEADEELRNAIIARNWRYYEGTQYDQDNADAAKALNLQPDQRMPEHQRLHAYSTQIAECLDFVANQITDGFAFIANAEAVQKIIEATITATDQLGTGEGEDLSFDDLVIAGGLAGDVPYEVMWDPIEETTYLEFWPAEQVIFDVPKGKWVEKVTRKQVIIVETFDGQTVVEREVRERTEYELVTRIHSSEVGPVDFEDPEVDTPYLLGDLESHMECRKQVFWDDNEEPESTEWLGLPMIPWGLLRIDKKGLTGFRGDPIVTRKAIDNADRYNANEQHAYLIARYNSHGNIAVVGDQAFLKLEIEPSVSKDVADVLRFPGGTNVIPITLPTDPQMIEHTKGVTSDAIYASFGLTRVEPDTLTGLGGISGYALEILNRKSDGTFRRIRRTLRADCRTMWNMALDVTAYRQGATLTIPELADTFEDDHDREVPPALLQPVNFWEIDPATVFSDRKIEVRMGSGYIVDHVMVRDDFVAGLISQEEALRMIGRSDPEIEKILGEQEAKKQVEFDRQKETLELQAQNQLQLAEVNAQSRQEEIKTAAAVAPKPPPKASPVKAGSTTGSTQRK